MEGGAFRAWGIEACEMLTSEHIPAACLENHGGHATCKSANPCLEKRIPAQVQAQLAGLRQDLDLSHSRCACPIGEASCVKLNAIACTACRCNLTKVKVTHARSNRETLQVRLPWSVYIMSVKPWSPRADSERYQLVSPLP